MLPQTAKDRLEGPATNNLEVITLFQNCNYTLQTILQDKFEYLIRRCLVKNLHHRYPSTHNVLKIPQHIIQFLNIHVCTQFLRAL